MIIYYPTYYLVPVVPVISIDQHEYDDRYNDKYSIQGNGEYGTRYNNEYRLGYNTEESGVYNIHRNVNVDIFEEADEEYVNERTE